MGRELPRTPLNRSALVDWLDRQALLEGPSLPPSVAEGLGRWVGWKQAFPLSAALQAPAGPTRPAPVSAAAVARLEREFTRVHERLVRTIDDDGAQAHDADYAPYRRHCTAVQQLMEADIGALRVRARAVLAQLSPALQRLAALDAVMDGVVSSHEQQALARLPSLLERRFTRLRQAHEAGAAPGWLHHFRADLRQALRAELDLRLQPAEGLLDALRAHHQETSRNP
jgi:Protein of unknown function (DUF3348)